jgi:hypothetical protein
MTIAELLDAATDAGGVLFLGRMMCSPEYLAKLHKASHGNILRVSPKDMRRIEIAKAFYREELDRKLLPLWISETIRYGQLCDLLVQRITQPDEDEDEDEKMANDAATDPFLFSKCKMPKS